MILSCFFLLIVIFFFCLYIIFERLDSTLNLKYVKMSALLLKVFLLILRIVVSVSDMSGTICKTSQCNYMLDKATKASAVSLWKSDPFGSIQLHYNIFDVNKVSRKHVEIRKLEKCRKRIKTKYFTTFQRYM